MSNHEPPLSPADPDAALAPGIRYGDIPQQLLNKVRTARDAGYEQVRSTYVVQGSPGLVILAEQEDDVRAAVRFAATQDVPFSIRSSGYGVSGTSTNTGGIVLDVSRINDFEVLDRKTRRLRIGAGATWGTVSHRLADYGWSMPAANAADLAMGGLASGAGIGWLVRRYGLAIDHLDAARLVLADGSVVRADADQHVDLYWAVRGAGGSVGVITQLEMTAVEVDDIVLGVLRIDAGDTSGFLRRWFDTLGDAPRELTTFVNLQAARADQPAVAQLLSVWCNGDEAAAERAMSPLLQLGPVLDQQAQRIPSYTMTLSQREQLTGQQRIQQRNGFLTQLTDDHVNTIAGLLAIPEVLQIELRTLGGAVGDIPADATAFAHREAQLYVSLWYDPQSRQAVDTAWAAVSNQFSGAYAAVSSDTQPGTVRAAYPHATYDRLLELKRRYDPHNLFSPHLFPELGGR